MNIAFLAPGFLPKWRGGGTMYLLYTAYLNPAHDRKTEQQQAQKKPQMKAPRVTPLEGVSTYALRGIGVRGVENPQGFGIDERRSIASPHYESFDICINNHPRNRTRMPRIARISTDPCASASSAQSVFNRFHSAPHHVPAQYERMGAISLLSRFPRVG